MALISLKDYAAENHITYEAVRQQVVRYAEELGGHIVKDGRQQFLDDEAVAFLDSKRQKNPVSIIQISKDEEIERLKQEKENLLVKIAAQADKISELSEWKAENALAIAEARQQQLLIEEKTKEIGTLEGFLRDANSNIEKQKEESRERERKLQEHYNHEIHRLSNELAAEKNKSFWKRLFGK